MTDRAAELAAGVALDDATADAIADLLRDYVRAQETQCAQLSDENQRLREALEKLHHTLTRPGVIGDPHLSIVRQALQESGDD